MQSTSFTDDLPAPRSRPAAPVRLHLADGVLAATQDALRDASAGEREALVLWAGRPLDGGSALISHLILPKFLSRRDFLTVPQDDRLVIANFLRTERLLAFADLHTHPRRAFLSEADRARPFSTRPGFYAAVIPDFAIATAAGRDWRFYEAVDGDWINVSPAERIDAWPV